MSLYSLQVITPLLGKHNVYNVLAAVAVGISLNINLKVPHTRPFTPVSIILIHAE